jgi:ATP-dependent Lhr-like helicase
LPDEQLTANARAVADSLRSEGALFFDDIVDTARLLPTQVEAALAELVALGLVNSDSFGGLRALLVPADRRASRGGSSRRRRMALFGMADAGRWALVRRASPVEGEPSADNDAVEHVVRTLLRRWGVLFWSVLAREADWLPPWRDLLRCCRRLEARGEIRGGRFVAGFSGEQYATLDAVGLLRDIRRKSGDGQWLSLSAADPLNLIGIVTPGTRLPALTGNRLLYRDGLPVAVFSGGEVSFLQELDAKEAWEAQNHLLRRHVPAVLADLA